MRGIVMYHPENDELFYVFKDVVWIAENLYFVLKHKRTGNRAKGKRLITRLVKAGAVIVCQ